MLHNRSLLIIYFIYRTVYMLIPVSWFICLRPPPHFPFGNYSVFFKFVSLCFVNNFTCIQFFSWKPSLNWVKWFWAWHSQNSLDLCHRIILPFLVYLAINFVPQSRLCASWRKVLCLDYFCILSDIHEAWLQTSSNWMKNDLSMIERV